MANIMRLGGGVSASLLPKGYTPLEYIESTGTQYIDLGISVPHATARVVVDFALTTVGGVIHGITGHANTDFTWSTNFLYLYKEPVFSICGGNVSGVNPTVGSRYIFDYTSAGYSVNGGAFVSAARAYTDGFNDTIFYSSSHYGAFKFYAYQLYDGETLVRDMMPCINDNGEVGLFDMVNGVFYGNAGSGQFLTPYHVSETPVLLWTNATPTSSFSEQAIGVDGSHFDSYIIECKNTTTGSHYGKGFINIGSVGSVAVNTGANSAAANRAVTATSASAITFGRGFPAGNSGSSSSAAIPTRIWGVNFTL